MKSLESRKEVVENAAHPRSTPPQLMEQYRRAYRMLAEQKGSNEAMLLLSGCVANDPGNLIFVETFLGCTQAPNSTTWALPWSVAKIRLPSGNRAGGLG